MPLRLHPEIRSTYATALCVSFPPPRTKNTYRKALQSRPRCSCSAEIPLCEPEARVTALEGNVAAMLQAGWK